MKIIITGDTHMPKRAKALPSRLVEELKTADLIIHTGDWQTMDVYEEFCSYGPVEGVAGNVDSEELIEMLGKEKIIRIGDFAIGLTHGDGKGKTTERRALDVFQDDRIDLLVFGHSHIPVLKESADCILFNPGSPTDKRRQEQYSFGVLEIGEKISLNHVFYKKKE